MGPSRWEIGIILGSVAAGVVVVLAALVVLPSRGPPSGTELVGGRLYTFESESLFGVNATGWSNFTYRGVVFGFHFWCGIPSPGGGVICGNATGSSGVSYPYSFFDGPPQPNPSWQLWISPDQQAAVQYRQGGLVHLLVAY